jgi:hypothetical protein
MPVYHHYQEAKKALSLPMADHIGACITCQYWDVEAPRPEEEKDDVGRCVQPQLKDFGLLVSGASACNHWEIKPDAGPEALHYAMLDEVAKQA